jgi:hypothetical protein
MVADELFSREQLAGTLARHAVVRAATGTTEGSPAAAAVGAPAAES